MENAPAQNQTPTAAGSPRADAIATLVLVFACFTLTSSGYLAWLYHLMVFAPPESVDVLSMGLGYIFQGLGIALIVALMRRKPEISDRTPFVAIVAFHFACAATASLSDNLAGTLAFGYVMCLLCGVVSGFYLLSLAALVRKERRGIVFGGGYACSVLASWLLSMAPLSFQGVPVELVSCGVFSLLAVVVALAYPSLAQLGAPGDTQGGSTALPDMGSPRDIATTAAGTSTGQGPAFAAAAESDAGGKRGRTWNLIVLAGTTVLLMSLVKNMGFSFPTADLGQDVSLELSRLFYAFGLVVAGAIIDKSRKMGGILCMAALVVPFAMLALANEPVSRLTLWAVDYFFYGFFSVFRVVVFADLAMQDGQPQLAPLGLMFGRFGDSLGTVMSISLASSTIALVAVAAVLFGATMMLFYQLFQQLYQPRPIHVKSEQEVFESFAANHSLSPREREILRLLLAERTNAEIAATLFISENTVKFHIRNVLKKAGAKNRVELLAKYSQER